MGINELKELVEHAERCNLSVVQLKVIRKTKARGERIRACGTLCKILNEVHSQFGFEYYICVPRGNLRVILNSYLKVIGLPKAVENDTRN